MTDTVGGGGERRALRRWRLVLGRYSEAGLRQPRLTEVELRADRALEYLYGRELDRRGLRPQRGGRHGSLDPSQLTALGWLREVRELFPTQAYETIQGHALDRYGMSELLKDPQLLAGITPSEDLLKALMTLKDRADPAVHAKIGEIARKVVDDIMRRLRSRVETALRGTRNRFASSPLKNLRNFDWRRTIRENLKNYDTERRVLVAERLRFHTRSRRRLLRAAYPAADAHGIGAGERLLRGGVARAPGRRRPPPLRGAGYPAGAGRAR